MPIEKAIGVEFPPPGAGLVTTRFRGPMVAVAPTDMFVVIRVALSTVTEFTVIPAPKFTVVVWPMKLLPRRTIFRVCDLVASDGDAETSVGDGLVTVNPEGCCPGRRRKARS
jgi:hypothetical protein